MTYLILYCAEILPAGVVRIEDKKLDLSADLTEVYTQYSVSQHTAT